MTGSRADALARLDVFVGEWVVDDGGWTLTRGSPDFTPLEFRQRFTGTFSADGSTISGAWEKGRDGGEWEHDFALTYRRTDSRLPRVDIVGRGTRTAPPE